MKPNFFLVVIVNRPIFFSSAGTFSLRDLNFHLMGSNFHLMRQPTCSIVKVSIRCQLHPEVDPQLMQR